jgi:hypothetical protein
MRGGDVDNRRSGAFKINILGFTIT